MTPDGRYRCGCGVDWGTVLGAWSCPRCIETLDDASFRGRQVVDTETGRPVTP